MTGSRRGRVGIALSVVVVVALLVSTRPAERRPDELGVAGTGPDGLGAIAAVLDELGVDVDERRGPAEPDDVLFVPRHVFPSERQREEVVEHLDAGGRAVVVGTGVDPDELRQQAFAPFGLGERTVEPGCEDARLVGVREADTVTNDRLVPDDGDVVCFGDTDTPGDEVAGLLLVAEAGAGDLVLLADDTFLRNGDVDEGDNAALAARLLAPSEPGGELVVLETAPDLDDDLFDLVGGRFWAVMWWLVLVFALYAVRRARRLGRPVAEQVPVVVEGADLVVAVGGLLARTGDRGAAAQDLRDQLRSDLAPRLGVDPSDRERLGEAAAQAVTGVDRETVELALGARSPTDDAGLVALARAVAATRAALTVTASAATATTTSDMEPRSTP